MRTTLNLDDEAVAQAMAASPGRTKTSVINEALRDYARRQRLAGYRALRGRFQWEGNLDELRERRPTRR
jgi:Arc/MetJ family transcription regulator